MTKIGGIILFLFVWACLMGFYFYGYYNKGLEDKDYDAIEIIPYNIAGTEQYIYTVRKTWVFTELEDAEMFRREQTGEEE